MIHYFSKKQGTFHLYFFKRGGFRWKSRFSPQSIRCHSTVKKGHITVKIGSDFSPIGSEYSQKGAKLQSNESRHSPKYHSAVHLSQSSVHRISQQSNESANSQMSHSTVRCVFLQSCRFNLQSSSSCQSSVHRVNLQSIISVFSPSCQSSVHRVNLQFIVSIFSPSSQTSVSHLNHQSLVDFVLLFLAIHSGSVAIWPRIGWRICLLWWGGRNINSRALGILLVLDRGIVRLCELSV